MKYQVQTYRYFISVSIFFLKIFIEKCTLLQSDINKTGGRCNIAFFYIIQRETFQLYNVSEV
jgi:hypothetical protein